jgi:uridylate kinase
MPTVVSPPYKRILLKISGEMLMGKQPFGIDPEACRQLVAPLQSLLSAGVQVGLVIGGGNIFRGIKLESLGIARSPADQMGMLATLMNGVALQQVLENAGCPTHVLSALDCPKVAESYTWKKALNYLQEGQLVIFVGGTGNPYFTTDTAAAMRAGEIQADILLKATKVDGIYTKDPLKNPEATKYDTLSYSQMLAEKLEVMDATSVALCRSNRTPIFVFNMRHLTNGGMMQVLTQQSNGTLVSGN